MILPYVSCGHFALGTISEQCFKDAIFDECVRQQLSKVPNSKMLNVTPKSKLVYNQMLLCLGQHISMHNLTYVHEC